MPSEPTSPAPDDLGLIARIADKDHAALRALVDRHWPAMQRHALALSGDAALAEDAVQEAFVSVWGHAASFRGEHGTARGWLYAIVRNAVRAQVRKKGPRLESLETDDLAALGEAAGFGDPDAVGSLQRALEDHESLEKGLALLGQDDREIVLLVDGEGLSLEEAAASLGVSLAATKSRLHRARLRLIAVLSNEEGS